MKHSDIFLITMRVHAFKLLFLCGLCLGRLELGFGLSKSILLPASKQVEKEKSSPPARHCTFDTIKYNISQSWYPLLLPYGYLSCVKCFCEMSKEGAKVVCNTKQCKTPSCSTPSIHDGECCKTCPGSPSNQHPPTYSPCEYNGQNYTHGSIWEVSDEKIVNQSALCTECSCSDGFVSCAMRTCPQLTCMNPSKAQNSCCPLCPSKVSEVHPGCNSLGRRYRENEQWYPLISLYKPQCIFCMCKNSKISCSQAPCNVTNCNKQCCNQCQESKPQTPRPSNETQRNILDRGQVRYPDCFLSRPHKHNTTWTPVLADVALSCVLCKCWNSRVNCWKIVCPHTYPCAKPAYKLGECCKQCEGQSPTKIKLHRLGWKSKRSCDSDNNWRVYEYRAANHIHWPGKSFDEIHGHFILESLVKDKVMLHTFHANKTYKYVNIKELHRSDLQIWKRMSSPRMLREIGIIRNRRRQKLEEKQGEKCTNNCLDVVRSFIKMVRIRSHLCRTNPISRPSSLLSLEEEGFR